MKQTVKRLDLIRLANGLEPLKKVENINVAYSISKNLNSLKGEIESIQAAVKGTEEKQQEILKDFNKDRMAIIDKHGKKDQEGKLITDEKGNGSVEESDVKVFENKINKLTKKYKKEIDLVNEKNKEINSFLDEDVKIEVFKIKIKDLPSDTSFERLDSIKEIIQ
jgi:uncharacterized protein YoxC